MKFKHIPFLILSTLSVNSFAMYANSEATAQNANFFVNTQHKAVADYEYGIQNNTRYTQVYTVTYAICAENKGCLTEKFNVRLDPTQKVQKKLKAELPVSYRITGIYRLTASIKVDGESKSEKTSFASLSVYNK